MHDQLLQIFSACKAKIGREESSSFFEEDVFWTVDHDLRYLRIVHQCLKDIKSSHAVKKRRRQVAFFFKRKIGTGGRGIDAVGDDLPKSVIIYFVISVHRLKDHGAQFRDRDIDFGRLFLFGLHG